MILRPKDVRAAEATDALFPYVWSSNPQINLIRIKTELKQRNVKLVLKLRFMPGNQYATTYSALRQIRLGRTFYSRPVQEQAGILAHEAVHIRRDVRVIPYMSMRYRCIEEIIAYRESFRIWIAQGIVSVSRIDDTIDKLISTQLEPIHQIRDPEVHAAARRIWKLDWE